METILEETHNAPYAMHLGTTKMYKALRSHYWWPIMKWDVAEFVSRCRVCPQVKVEYQALAGTLGSLPIPEGKWKWIQKGFVLGLPRTPQKHDVV